MACKCSKIANIQARNLAAHCGGRESCIKPGRQDARWPHSQMAMLRLKETCGKRLVVHADEKLTAFLEVDQCSTLRRLRTHECFTKIPSLSTGGCLHRVRRSNARALVLVIASALKVHLPIARAMPESTRKHLKATSDASPYRGDTALVDPKSS